MLPPLLCRNDKDSQMITEQQIVYILNQVLYESCLLYMSHVSSYIEFTEQQIVYILNQVLYLYHLIYRDMSRI